jgi:hypothetical protein
MGLPIPAPHASVAVRSRRKRKFDHTLVAIAIAATLALAALVSVLDSGADKVASTNRVVPAVQEQAQLPAGTRFDGGPDEGTRGLSAQAQQLPAGTRFDGGPDEGTRGPQPSYSESPLRSYQPAPADSAEAPIGGPRMIPMGPGGR